jgi:hypothetical protein
MSELIMRKYARYDFHERNRLWSGRKQNRLEKMRSTRGDQENYPFTPSIIADPPKFVSGKVEKKKGVKTYLDRIKKMKMMEERDKTMRARRKVQRKFWSNSAPISKHGPQVTIPEEQDLTLNKKKDNAFSQKFDKRYLTQLKGIEHKAFLEVVPTNPGPKEQKQPVSNRERIIPACYRPAT